MDTDPELVEIWAALRMLNANQLTLSTALTELHAALQQISNRLLIQEAYTAVSEMDQPRRSH